MAANPQSAYAEQPAYPNPSYDPAPAPIYAPDPYIYSSPSNMVSFLKIEFKKLFLKNL